MWARDNTLNIDAFQFYETGEMFQVFFEMRSIEKLFQILGIVIFFDKR